MAYDVAYTRSAHAKVGLGIDKGGLGFHLLILPSLLELMYNCDGDRWVSNLCPWLWVAHTSIPMCYGVILVSCGMLNGLDTNMVFLVYDATTWMVAGLGDLYADQVHVVGSVGSVHVHI